MERLGLGKKRVPFYLKFPANTIHFRHLLLVNMQSSRELLCCGEQNGAPNRERGRFAVEGAQPADKIKYSWKKAESSLPSLPLFQFAQQPVLASGMAFNAESVPSNQGGQRRQRQTGREIGRRKEDKCVRSAGHTNEQIFMLWKPISLLI